MKDRLTINEVIEHCDRYIRNANSFAEAGFKVDKSSKQYLEHLQVAEWLKELKEYKNLEEQGLLLRLPCKVGDTIYVIPSLVNFRLNELSGHSENNRVYEQQVHSVRLFGMDYYMLVTCDGIQSVLSQFYKVSWFLTREEAEKALEKMKGDSNG